MPKHDAYRSLTPWTGFTPRERKRAAPLCTCPAAACRRAKACVSAIEALYCRRTHMTVAEARQAAGGDGLVEMLPRLPARPTLRQVKAHALASDILLARAAGERERLTAQWRAGELDHLYGKYDPKGVWMRPPPRLYVEK
jgi:hypothetical protein